MPREKPIAFRPSPELKAKIRDYKETNGIKSSAKAVMKMLSECKIDKPILPTLQPSRKKSFSFLATREINESPLIKKEVDRMMRGQHSDLIETLCNVTETSLNRSFTVAGKNGLIIVIPTSHNP